MKKAELEKKYKEGKKPKLGELQGRCVIKIYPRWKWWLFRDVKLIAQPPDVQRRGSVVTLNDEAACVKNLRPTGVNRAWGFLYWGRFFISETETKTDICLNYRNSRWPFNHIRDYLRRLGPGLYGGPFCVVTRKGKEKQKAMFTLEPDEVVVSEEEKLIIDKPYTILGPAK